MATCQCLAKPFIVHAKDLTLEGEQWKWYTVDDEQVAELLTGKDFNIYGKFDCGKLIPAQPYEVSFQIMMTNEAQGFDVPVKLELCLPNGNTIPNKEDLSGKPKNTWVDVKVSTFKNEYGMSGEMTFSMYQFGDGLMKKGLVIKSATISPQQP